MNNKQRKALAAIMERPTRADGPWPEIESLLRALGAEMTEGRGSRLCVALNGQRMVIHRPHPSKIAGKAMVESMRRFLKNSGVAP
jgi:hypothetical protein